MLGVVAQVAPAILVLLDVGQVLLATAQRLACSQEVAAAARNLLPLSSRAPAEGHSGSGFVRVTMLMRFSCRCSPHFIRRHYITALHEVAAASSALVVRSIPRGRCVEPVMASHSRRVDVTLARDDDPIARHQLFLRHQRALGISRVGTAHVDGAIVENAFGRANSGVCHWGVPVLCYFLNAGLSGDRHRNACQMTANSQLTLILKDLHDFSAPISELPYVNLVEVCARLDLRV